MIQKKEAPRLFCISPGEGLGPDLDRRLQACVRGGLRAFQLREKASFTGDLVDKARSLRRILPKGESLFVINDRVDVALAADLDGVHLGGHSMSVVDARRLLGADAWIGVSVHDVDQLSRACDEGADYVFVSPVFPTRKAGFRSARSLGLRAFAELVELASVPVFALGGIQAERVREVRGCGAHGVAVLSGLRDAVDAEERTESYMEELE